MLGCAGQGLPRGPVNSNCQVLNGVNRPWCLACRFLSAACRAQTGPCCRFCAACRSARVARGLPAAVCCFFGAAHRLSAAARRVPAVAHRALSVAHRTHGLAAEAHSLGTSSRSVWCAERPARHANPNCLVLPLPGWSPEHGHSACHSATTTSRSGNVTGRWESLGCRSGWAARDTQGLARKLPRAALWRWSLCQCVASEANQGKTVAWKAAGCSSMPMCPASGSSTRVAPG